MEKDIFGDQKKYGVFSRQKRDWAKKRLEGAHRVLMQPHHVIQA